MSEAIQLPVDPAEEADSRDRLILLANASMRARRRPLVIVAMWGLELALGILIAWPMASVVRAAYGQDPMGDAHMWKPGGLELLNLLLHSDYARSAALTHAALVLAIVTVLGIFPMAALITSVAYTTSDLRAPPLRKLLARAADSFQPLMILMLLVTFVEVIFVLIAVLAAEGLSGALAPRLGDARAEQLGLAVLLLFLGCACVVGVVHDLARAAVVRFRVGSMRALRLAGNALRQTPTNAVWSWTWRTSAGLVPLVIGAAVAAKLGGRGGGALLGLMIIHQLVILTRVALRASWLAKALRLVDKAHRVMKVTPPPAVPLPPPTPMPSLPPE